MMSHQRKTELQQKYDEIIKREILKMDKSGMGLDDIDEVLVSDMGFSPEYSWKMIKSTLKLKTKTKTIEDTIKEKFKKPKEGSKKYSVYELFGGK